jgi:hypothetical protein
MDTHKITLDQKGAVRLQTKNQQQEKKAKLASALRDNLRRRKVAVTAPSVSNAEDSSE